MLAIAWVVFVPAADWFASHDVGRLAGPLRVLHLQTARDAARGRLLTLGAGLFAAAALVFTARNFTLSRRTLELTEQGQVTDRYTKAIEQLGSDKLDVRLGGIYGMERVARDSPRDHPTVMEVLAAFIREHSHEQWPLGDESGAVPDRTTRPDVQAALTVIARRDIGHDREAIDLSAANLSCARLPGASLARANLGDADLSRADLIRANLTGADLGGAALSRAKLAEAILNRADLTGADLRTASLFHAYLVGARFYRANLADASLAIADLAGANLSRANLTGASLSRANLTTADLTDADLTGADLTGARWSEERPAPEGWVHDGGGRLRSAREATGDPGT